MEPPTSKLVIDALKEFDSSKEDVVFIKDAQEKTVSMINDRKKEVNDYERNNRSLHR